MHNIDFAKNGSAYITSKIEEAVKNESRTATISGNWEIREAVRLPSNFTLILQNAHAMLLSTANTNSTVMNPILTSVFILIQRRFLKPANISFSI